MAGTIQSKPNVPPPAGAVDEREEDLASRLENDGAFADVEEQNRPAGQVERTEDATPASDRPGQPDPVAELRQQLEDQRAEWKQERAQLIGALNRSQQQPTPVVVQAPVQAPTRPAPRSREDLLKSLNDAPLDTVQNLIGEAIAENTRQLREEFANQVSGVKKETRAEAEFRSRTEADRNQVRTEFADLYDDPKLGSEFDNEAAQELIAICNNGENWEKTYRPGDAYNAASRVHSRWVRLGKIAGATANGGTNGTGLREIIRNGPISRSDRSTSSPGMGRGGNSGSAEPRTISDLVSRGDITATEGRAALRVMKDMGSTEQIYVANWLAAKQNNPSFGRG